MEAAYMDDRRRNSFSHKFLLHIRSRVISGILVLVPVAITVIIMQIVLGMLTRFLLPVFKATVPGVIPQGVVLLLSLLALLLLCYLVGLIAALVIGKKLIRIGESIIMRVPIAKTVYAAARQVVDSLSAGNKTRFKAVTFVEHPRRGIWATGFIMGSFVDAGGKTWNKVFIPTAPNPTSGFLQMVPEKDAMPTDISVEDGFKMIVSAGVLTPPGLVSLDFRDQ